jgi:hypothetical protein
VPFWQMVCGPPTVAVVGCCSTVTTTDRQIVAGQPGDSQRAKYVVVAVGEAMTSGVPDPTGVTPQLPEYHWSIGGHARLCDT